MRRKISPAKILVVDDNPFQLDETGRCLQREGYIAIQAPSSADCLRIVNESAVDLIVLNSADNQALCGALRNAQASTGIPIIMARPDKLGPGGRHGELLVDDFLSGRFSRRQLLARIDLQLKLREQRRSNSRPSGARPGATPGLSHAKQWRMADAEDARLL